MVVEFPVLGWSAEMAGAKRAVSARVPELVTVAPPAVTPGY